MIGTKENPIQVDSIRNSLNYLNNLVTEDGYNIIYHRLGSIRESKILDHYQAVDTNGRYHELYIDPYADEMMRVPPTGFLFKNSFFDYHDIFNDTEVDEKYVYEDNIDTEEYVDYLKTKPFAFRMISDSWGTNFQVNFPEDVIHMMVKDQFINIHTDEQLTKLIEELKNNEPSNGN
jgi:hypothetical protein